MNVIFLDMDGVLCTPFTRPMQCDTKACELFRGILEATDAKVVISSTWRKMMGPKEIAKLADFDYERIIGVTPDLRGRPRGSEIVTWLAMNRVSMEIDRFVILDDDADMAPLLEHLIQTKFQTGLTAEIADRVIKRLKGES